MQWLLLILAGLFEIIWAIGLKYTAGFTLLEPSIITIVAMAISVYLLAKAVKTLPIGTAYAIWTGIGSAGTVILGILLFGESASIMRLVCVGAIIFGVVGLKLTAEEDREVR